MAAAALRKCSRGRHTNEEAWGRPVTRVRPLFDFPERGGSGCLAGRPRSGASPHETRRWNCLRVLGRLARFRPATHMGQMLPPLGQESAQLCVSDLTESGARKHHHVQLPELPAMMAKAVPDYPLYSVAAYRPADLSSRNRHSEASSTHAVGTSENAYLLASGPQRLGEHSCEVPGAGESEVPGKAGSGRRGIGVGIRALQALSRLRPLARRFLMIRRPAFVAMRARKP